MVSVSLAGAALTAATLFSSFASAVEYITVNGPNFVTNSTGNRFSIIGVDYQPGGSSGFSATADPLSDPTACLRDAILMQQLGVNTIRVYNLDANLNHDECASIFNAAGIYMVLDVNSGLDGQYIDRTDPASTYTLEYMQHIFGVVEAFAGYPNTLGFWAANEILNQQSTYVAPLYIRAVVRDLKEYIALHVNRPIGVGYAAADVAQMLGDTWNYLGCSLSNSTYSTIDFFGLNDYEWCGDSSFTQSGYNALITLFQSTDIPVFFSEYGCNQVEPRTFTNVPVLYGPQMTVMSGGLVYEFTEEPDNYGLISVNSSTEVTLLIDYSYLSQQYLAIDMQSVTTKATAGATATPSTCTPAMITETNFYNAWDLPARPSGGDDLVTSGLSSANIGSLTSVTATTMPATVYNYTGTEVTGLALVQLGCADNNAPGLVSTYSAGAETCSYATSSPTAVSGGSGTGSGSSSSHSKSAATTRAPPVDIHGIATLGVVFVSFLVGTMML